MHSANRLHNHLQHEGERQVQTLRSVPPDLTMMLTNMIDEKMPEQHATFFQNLFYFAVCVCDNEGRPWSTLLTRSIAGVNSPSTFIHVVDSSRLQITCLVPQDDPCAIYLQSGRCWAGLGVDFSNRRRNKVAGIIEHSKMDHNAVVEGRVLLTLVLITNENLGNCPKYITVRPLVQVDEYPPPDNKVVAIQDRRLNQNEIDMINRASTVYLATRHLDVNDQSSSDMGLNHRGGQPGFIRCQNFKGIDEKEHHTEAVPQSYSVIYLPDYSGNRFFQSLGNVQSDRVAGLLIPDFGTGDILYLTGTAENIFGAEADLIMPRVQFLTKIYVTGHVMIHAAIANLRLNTAVPEQFSPYNPPVRPLRSEITDMLGGEYFSIDGDITCRLVDVKQLTSQVSTFIFETDQPFHQLGTLLPGGYAIFDFSSILTRQYGHMNHANPKQVNDDLIRTWTISSASSSKSSYDDMAGGQRGVRFSCTIKRSGLISSLLHKQSAPYDGKFVVPLKGVGGDFSCFTRSADRLSLVSKSMLWIAGGVGCTPFLSMLAALKQESREADTIDSEIDIHMLLAVRGDEEALADELRRGMMLRQVIIFNSSNSSSQCDLGDQKDRHNYFEGMTLSAVATVLHRRRMTSVDIKAVDNLLSRSVYLCGPIPFMEAVSGWLQQLGVPTKSIHRESFF